MMDSEKQLKPLVENRSVRQRPEEGFRRWFTNGYFDIIIWYQEQEGPLTGFQLCYSKNHGEKAFTWHADKTASHYVSDGSDRLGLNRLATGILTGNAGPVPQQILSRLEQEQGELPQPLLELVLQRVQEFNQRNPVA
jgi:hypothetical protein